MQISILIQKKYNLTNQLPQEYIIQNLEQAQQFNEECENKQLQQEKQLEQKQQQISIKPPKLVEPFYPVRKINTIYGFRYYATLWNFYQYPEWVSLSQEDKIVFQDDPLIEAFTSFNYRYKRMLVLNGYIYMQNGVYLGLFSEENIIFPGWYYNLDIYNNKNWFIAKITCNTNWYYPDKKDIIKIYQSLHNMMTKEEAEYKFFFVKI